MKWLLMFLAVFLLIPYGYGQECREIGSTDDTLNKKLGEPVIFGKSAFIPSMAWHFESKDQSYPQSVEFRYQWQWIQYPYPEHAWGAWVTSSETVKCISSGENLTVPPHTVKPRGWYEGKHTFLPWRKPKFIQVEMVVNWELNCTQRVMLDNKLLNKFKDNEGILTKSCGAPVKPKFISK